MPLMPSNFNFLCKADRSIPIKSAVFDMFPWFFFSCVVRYSFSNFSLASFKGEEKLSLIDVLSSIKGKKILIIGDMAELGNDSNKYHQELGDYIKKSSVDFTLAVGRHIKITMQQLDKNAFWFDTKDKLLKKLSEIIDTKSIILVKGSRHMEMEEIVSKII